jgi:hypothetical protein
MDVPGFDLGGVIVVALGFFYMKMEARFAERERRDTIKGIKGG